MLRYAYTFWLWFKNVFIDGIILFSSLLYYFSFVAVSVKGLLFGAYCVVPIIRPFFRNNVAFQFIIGQRLMDHVDENDMTLRGVFIYFLLPYTVYMIGVMAIRWGVQHIFGG